MKKDMDDNFYREIGFKAGLEAHQQLETHKLFCRCPSLVNDPNKADIKFQRKLRSVLSERGEADEVAEFEMQKNKTILYEACSSSSCLVEMDEEPPNIINQQALIIALEIARLFNAKIVDEIQIMRKAVADGSVTSGFQRTMLVARKGCIETTKGKVNIETIMLEEEAAKKISETALTSVYRLDRLGVPLVEIATGPDIKTPEHAKECASVIGMVLRSTNKVKRGIGTIRQDVNLSIKGHPRIEIKGFQDIKNMPRVISNEVTRQIQNLKSGKELKPEVRKFNPNYSTDFLRPMPGSARMYPETDHSLVKITMALLETLDQHELITEKALKIERLYNIPENLALEIVRNKIDFEFYARNLKNIPPDFIARVLIEYPKELKRRYKLDAKFEIMPILRLLDADEITKEAVFEIMLELNLTGKRLDEILQRYKPVSEQDIKKSIASIISELKSGDKEPKINEVMGRLMNKYRGKIDGKAAAKLIKDML